MSDIFREVEEDVRRERYEQLWKQYGDYVLAGVAILVIAAAGFQLWRYYENRERLRAAQEFMAAQEVAAAGAPEKAAEAFGKLADTAPGGYAQLARLQHADTLISQGKTGEAVELYKKIADSSDEILGGVARLRAAWAIVDNAPKKDVETLLAPLTAENSGWQPYAAEVLAYSDYHAGNGEKAIAEFRSIEKNKNAPEALRTRASVMADFIAAGGEANYGTLPKPAPKKADAAQPAQADAAKSTSKDKSPK